ncbi:MAG: ABC transporter ATP-binding protein [Ilumatobacter sp.]|uniref:ABC transporter ATP-binding protein n=1 Tax=Ilumatobacter sp. TaxID=1967498 RepID=UPI0026227866|nr:ABC transporter ATP-binding protein [Ilumatobacter sp.]MDJ0769970.1 ABC transporter ATP-binding protein [Ilumatobacter sp.]
MLQAEGISKRYGEIQALSSADLDVAAGQIVSVLGRNGAGKSTMLSIIAGLLTADAGTVHIGGIDASVDPESAARLLGIAPQSTGIYTVLTVRENLEFFGELAGFDRRHRSRRAEEVAEQLGLADLLDRRAGKLSGGEARRLHTACALVHAPALLMLDEPTVGADVETRRQLIQAVRNLASDGAAIVYTTHYLPEVEALDADIVIIDEGRILARGSRDELVASHRLSGVRFHVEGPLPENLELDVDVAAPSVYHALGDVTMADLLEGFGDDAHRLVSVESLAPDLETVFLAVTGHDIGSSADTAEGS